MLAAPSASTTASIRAPCPPASHACRFALGGSKGWSRPPVWRSARSLEQIQDNLFRRLIGEYERLRERVPVAAGLWLLLLLVGMFGTIAFGLQGFFEGAFGSHDRVGLERFADYPPQSLLVLWLPGPAFPAAMLVFGALLLRTRTAPWWDASLICLAAIAFPLARVLRLEWVAYVVDVLVIIAFAHLAWRAWLRTTEPTGDRHDT